MHAFTALDSPRSGLRALPRLGWIALGGVVFAAADLAVAALFWGLRNGIPAIRIPQAIASWVLGSNAAHAGGMATAIAGFALYCAVMGVIVDGFVRLHARSARVRASGFIGGALYGMAAYVLLFHVCVPLFTAVRETGATPLSWLLACAATFAGIGIGCVGIARVTASR
ncbi:hypothetical protein LYSHEL_05400 [Lysobacter helvus]|uniref:DUF2177 family protein n=2 Tax=Lysobacteraceae TaxID=32033 RepID=A0ABN6FQ19_9GAMM|nr:MULTISPECIES: hypothetical protein [Lysobacter]BCT91516.1 hypothetical protein LYSCAS_05400 [Lysobacter caseinilyticus]BCT94669.1 hypothetical protein LYSHEL_05400 [Lysobacter helvus]